MNFRLKMIREQRIGVLFLLGIILLAEVFIHKESLFDFGVKEEKLPVSVQEEVIAVNSQKNKFQNSNLESFNPNDYTQEDWKKLGFSEKQAAVILKYKDMLGGKFTSREQIKNCFVVSEEKYQELSPFLLLPETSTDSHSKAFVSLDKKYQLKKFDQNVYSVENWKSIGFSEKQAEVILKYKGIVGGKFVSKEQLKKCFVISGEKYAELAPFIQLPEKASFEESSKPLSVVPAGKKELNSASFQDVVAVIDDPEVAGKLIGFRKGLGGFVSQDQIRNVYGITPEKTEMILKNFDLNVSKVHKISLETATENELQNQIYLRKYKSKIMEARKSGEAPLSVIPKSDPNYSFILLYIK